MSSCPYVNRGEEGYVPVNAFFHPLAVQDLADEILSKSNKHPFNAVLEWVILNVPYVSDLNQFTKVDYWQYPEEAIASGAGDCEDESFLVASLLIALGFVARIAIGNTPYGYHAWCEAQDDSGCWWLLESTMGKAFKITSYPALGYEIDLIVEPEGCVEEQSYSY